METIADRLVRARESAGYARATEAIEAFGFSQFTYYQHENGTREPSKAALERYAKAFRVSVDWLWRGVGEMRGATSDPDTAEIIGIIPYLKTDDRTKLADFARFLREQAERSQAKKKEEG